MRFPTSHSKYGRADFFFFIERMHAVNNHYESHTRQGGASLFFEIWITARNYFLCLKENGEMINDE